MRTEGQKIITDHPNNASQFKEHMVDPKSYHVSPAALPLVKHKKRFARNDLMGSAYNEIVAQIHNEYATMALD